MSNKQPDPQRPYYRPKPKRAIVIPVDDWTISKALFVKGKKSNRNRGE